MKNLRNYISSNKEQFDTAKAPDAWNDILAEIKPEKKKRGFIYWSAAAAILIISGVGFWFNGVNHEAVAAKDAIKENRNVPGEFKNRSNKEEIRSDLSNPTVKGELLETSIADDVEITNKVELSDNGNSGDVDKKLTIGTYTIDLDSEIPIEASTDVVAGDVDGNTYNWTESDNSASLGFTMISEPLYSLSDDAGFTPRPKHGTENMSFRNDNSENLSDIDKNLNDGIDCYVGMGEFGEGYFVHDLEPINYEEYEVLLENQFLNPISDPFSTFSIDVDGAAYSICRRYINGGQLPPKGAVKAEEITNYFEYDYPGPTGDHPFAIYTELAAAPWSQDHDLLKVTIKGEEVDLADAPANNLVFLVDVSGSMDSPDKLGLLKESFVMLANEMRNEDKITIVTYAGNAGVLLPTTTGRHKDRIIDALGSLTSGGGTNGAGGIKEAYRQAEEAFIEDGNNRIILATDGDFNVGVSSDNGLVRMIEKQRESGIFLSVLGFGTGNLQSDKMEKLSQNGNGNWNYIDNVMESNKVLIEEMGGTLITIAKDMKLQLEFNPQIVKNYRLIGYENRMLEKEDFENDAVDAGDLGAGLEVTAFYEIERTDEVVAEIDSEGSKYIHSKTTVKEGYDDEMVTVNIRYKEPDGEVSKLITKTQSIEHTALSDDFFLACAATEFALVLRESEFAGASRLEHVKKMLEHNNIKSRDAYTKEFYGLVIKSIDLKNEVSD